MADLMQRLEQHAAAYSLLGEKDLPALLREAAAALRAVPEGGVPERTMMALATGWRRHAAAGGRGRTVLIQCAESLEAAVIAARSQGVKDAG